MERRRVAIGEPFPEVLRLLERIVGGLGCEPVRLRPAMRHDPPQVDLLVLARSYALGRELARPLRRRNPGLPVLYVDKPFRLEQIRTAITRALAPRRVRVSVTVR